MSLSKAEYNKATFFYNEIMNSFQMDFSLYADLVEILKPKSVLEFGCGMGRLFPIFMKKAKFITGIDLSDEMLAKGKKYFADNNPEDAVIEFHKSDMRSFKEERKYDMIVMALSVLKHLNTDEERFKALKNAKEHLNEDGFIIIDHTPFLYASHSTGWVDAKDSMVANWVPNKRVLEGYQWKKSVEGNTDILHWRYKDLEKTQFEVSFTTYHYDTDKLIEHISMLDMCHERFLTEWGINGLASEGKRFIGLISHSPGKQSLKQKFLDKVVARDERLWSGHT